MVFENGTDLSLEGNNFCSWVDVMQHDNIETY